MHLFTRTAQVTGPLREAFGWAADVSAMFAALDSQDGYHEVLARGREFLAAPAEDEIRQLVHGVPLFLPGSGHRAPATTLV